MDDASSHKRKAKQMYEPRPRALHLDETGEQQGEREHIRRSSHELAFCVPDERRLWCRLPPLRSAALE
jgi:hypothetical protein